MRFCSKCRKNKFETINLYGVQWWQSGDFFQVFGKWICSDCFLRSGRGKKQILRQAKSKLRKRVPPKSIRERSYFERLEERGLIELRKRWVREDLNRVFECYRVLKPLDFWDYFHIKLARKPKKGQMIWREIKTENKEENKIAVSQKTKEEE